MADENQNPEILRRILQQDVVPGAIKPRHLVGSPLANGDLYYSDGTDFINLPIGSANQTLTVISGVPTWSNAGVASYLATTGAPVNVSLAAPPTTGQVLTATSATTATWQAASSGTAVLFTQTANKTVTNTLTETTLIGTGVGSVTLSANYLTVGKTIRLTMRGQISTDAVVAPNNTLQITLGGTNININGSTDFPIGLDLNSWVISFDFTCRSVGATGTVVSSGFFSYQNPPAILDPTTMNAMEFSNDSPVTIDTTGTLAIDITTEWDTADTDNTITSQIFVIESLG